MTPAFLLNTLRSAAVREASAAEVFKMLRLVCDTAALHLKQNACGNFHKRAISSSRWNTSSFGSWL
jgi:hypothetical protein